MQNFDAPSTVTDPSLLPFEGLGVAAVASPRKFFITVFDLNPQHFMHTCSKLLPVLN